MASFKVVLKRVAYAEVVIEAGSAAEIKRILGDEEVIHETFHSADNTWYDADIKIVSVDKGATA